jgi:hypothetical protein
MLIQTLIQQPRMLGPIVQHTPMWVGGLLAGLAVLGLTQVKSRKASRARVMLLPATMTAMSIWGTASAFGASPLFGSVVLAWLIATALGLAPIATMAAPRGASYDSASGTFHLPGSWVPMGLIVAVFLTKYVVGVDLAMQPALAQDLQYTLIAGVLYGVSSGIFIGRAARLWRLAARPAPVNGAALNA